MGQAPRPATRQIRLPDLIAGIDTARIVADAVSADTMVSGIELDSRLIRPGDCFAAIPGHHAHGIDFARSAMDRGAVALLTDEDGLSRAPAGIPVIVVEHPRDHLGELSARVYGNAANSLTLVGVTGTNGKTTVSYMVEAGLRAAGRSTGVIGTVGIRIGDEVVDSARTTPESVHLHAILGTMRDRGVDTVVMEVSSHALCEGRVDGLQFALAGFTNLSQDHLDYHRTMEEYFLAKASLFTAARARAGVVGVDDDWGHRLSVTATIPITTWSMEADADWTLIADGPITWMIAPDGDRTAVRVPLPGAFNRANALCAFAMLRALGIDASHAAQGIEAVAVPGRMEVVGLSAGICGIVDYAHTPDAIEGAVLSARERATGRVIVVVGAGGDRDREKRPLMGAAAARLGDRVLVTDDNPRSEDPAAIRAAVFEGAAAVSTEVAAYADRRLAIHEAVRGASAGDVVLVLGKGHEQGQEISGVVHPFDDRQVLRDAMQGLT